VRELNAFLALAYRDIMKLLRDPARLAATFVFPFVFIAVLGGSFQSAYGEDFQVDFLAFFFTGVLAQTLFQSSAMGIVSLLEDREHDFSQEIFIAPISRYTIVLGKIAGEALVALAQGVGIVAFGLVLGVSLPLPLLARLVPIALAICFFGGGFGVMLLANLGSQRAANQIFPFILLPQYFLAGVFSPIRQLDGWLELVSRLSPMRYAVDLFRGVYYTGRPDYARIVVDPPASNLVVVVLLFAFFMVVGTALFVRREQNR
jgi:ABC-2 type transport system permease protein